MAPFPIDNLSVREISAGYAKGNQMGILKKVAAVGAATAAISVISAGGAFANGPTYAWQSGVHTVDRCQNTTSGGTAVGGWAHGQFVANSDGGGGCSVTYLELVYVDNSGNEQAKYVQSNWGSGSDTCGASCDQIVWPTSSYQRIIEVVGSSQSGLTGNSTGGIYLYY
ncbi:hypothetical protein ABH935_005993 [Catenulispora sp. GAS73]